MSGTRFELSPSWILAGAILALHAAAAASVVAATASAPGYALGAALLALGIAAVWARAALRSGRSVVAIALSGPQLVLELRNGERLVAEPGTARHVSRFMVTLPVRRPMHRTILVTRDMLRPEEFRRLRLWALWGRLPVAGKQLQA